MAERVHCRNTGCEKKFNYNRGKLYCSDVCKNRAKYKRVKAREKAAEESILDKKINEHTMKHNLEKARFETLFYQWKMTPISAGMNVDELRLSLKMIDEALGLKRRTFPSRDQHKKIFLQTWLSQKLHTSSIAMSVFVTVASVAIFASPAGGGPLLTGPIESGGLVGLAYLFIDTFVSAAASDHHVKHKIARRDKQSIKDRKSLSKVKQIIFSQCRHLFGEAK